MITPPSLVESLILAAGGRDEDVHRLVGEHGLSACAAELIAELVSRCAPPPFGPEVPPLFVLLDIRYGEEQVTELLAVTGASVGTALDAPDTPHAHITTDLLDLVRSLFGPVRYDGDSVREVSVRTDWAPPAPAGNGAQKELEFRQLDRPNPLAMAVQTVTAACASRRAELSDLAIRFGTDKWGMWHWYTRHYDRHFSALRDEPIKLLEIGIGGYTDPRAGGGSLRMWKNYFPRAIVYGMDIYDKSGVEESRIHTIQGSQADAEFLREFAEANGPFDIIIDDGSHLNEHVLFSFDVLFPHVRQGGWYAIEDMQTSYWPQYGGVRGDTAGDGTSIGLLKRLLDGLEHQESRGTRAPENTYSDRHIVGMHCYHNLALIEKGVNAEPTTPGWVKRAPVNYFYPQPSVTRK